jgi:hypothetical protein
MALDAPPHTSCMDGLGDAVGGAISTAIGRAVDAFGQAVTGVGNAFMTVPGGAAWLVVIAVVVGGAWMLARR